MLGTLRGRVVVCWSFREVGCSLLVAMVKEETKGKKFSSEIFLIPLSPLSFFLSYLVLEGKTGEIKGGKKKKLQSSKDEVQVGGWKGSETEENTSL